MAEFNPFRPVDSPEDQAEALSRAIEMVRERYPVHEALFSAKDDGPRQDGLEGWTTAGGEAEETNISDYRGSAIDALRKAAENGPVSIEALRQVMDLAHEMSDEDTERELLWLGTLVGFGLSEKRLTLAKALIPGLDKAGFKGDYGHAKADALFFISQLDGHDLSDLEPEQAPEFLQAAQDLAREIRRKEGPLAAREVLFSFHISESMEKVELWKGLVSEWNDGFPKAINLEFVEWQAKGRVEWLRQLGQETRPDPEAERRLIGSAQLMDLINAITGQNQRPRRPPLDSAMTAELFRICQLSYVSAFANPPSAEDERLKKVFIATIENLAAGRDIRSLELMDQLFARIRIKPMDPETAYCFMESVGTYADHHGLDRVRSEGLLANLLPALEKQDPQIKALIRGGNIWGMKRGDFGLGDYICHVYALPVTPANINELLMAMRDIPTTELHKLEQNRRDALCLVGPFGGLRDLIHDERPGVHELISAMVDYGTKQDTANRQEIERVLKHFPHIEQQIGSEVPLDLQRYSAKLEKDKHGTDEDVMTILSRLKENTEPITEQPPKTDDPALDKAMADLSGATERSEKNSLLQQALAAVNARLEHDMKDRRIGMEPNFVMAIAWLERQATAAIRAIDFEGQSHLYRQPWFREALRFQSLTCAPVQGLADKDYLTMQQKLDEAPSKILEGEDAYAKNAINEYLREQIHRMSKKYRAEGYERWIGAIDSGNLTHELMSVCSIWRPASSAVGQRAREELNKLPSQRSHGD